MARPVAGAATLLFIGPHLPKFTKSSFVLCPWVYLVCVYLVCVGPFVSVTPGHHLPPYCQNKTAVAVTSEDIPIFSVTLRHTAMVIGSRVPPDTL